MRFCGAELRSLISFSAPEFPRCLAKCFGRRVRQPPNLCKPLRLIRSNVEHAPPQTRQAPGGDTRLTDWNCLARGVRVQLVSVLFLAVVGLTVAGCSQIVGVLLVFALMVGPAAAAQRLSSRIGTGVLLSALLALAEAWAGVALAYVSDWPSSFWITALSALVYFASLFAAAPAASSAPRASDTAMAE